jgi:hypothetical protein
MSDDVPWEHACCNPPLLPLHSSSKVLNDLHPSWLIDGGRVLDELCQPTYLRDIELREGSGHHEERKARKNR